MAENVDKTIVKRAVNGLVDTFCHALDPKKRLTIPSEWRDALGNPAYVYLMPSASEDCLELIPVELMERTLQQYQNADLFDDEADADAQAIAQFAQMLKVDAAGRIRIGDNLLGHAGIAGGVTMIGAIRKAKLWAVERKPYSAKGKLDLSAFRAVASKRKLLAGAKKGLA
jgi:division/cell wall cluster transcriptional repressor MraZ